MPFRPGGASDERGKYFTRKSRCILQNRRRKVSEDLGVAVDSNRAGTFCGLPQSELHQLEGRLVGSLGHNGWQLPQVLHRSRVA